jgi:hypothetical protein
MLVDDLKILIEGQLTEDQFPNGSIFFCRWCAASVLNDKL